MDLKGGRVARFDGQGPETVYALDPLAVAQGFLAGGASWLHVVDLDRAFDTGSDNDALIRRIASLNGARLQMGGSLAEVGTIERALALGAARAVVATAAAADPRRLEEIVGRVPPGRLAVAAEVRSGRLAPRGASRPLSLPARELARRALDLGVEVLVYRDLDRDGQLRGPDLEGAAALLDAGTEVILAGGISSLAHLEAARQAGMAGAIVGRALYEGRFSLSEALACSA